MEPRTLIAACGESQTASRADLFRQLSVPESRETTSIPAIRRLDLTKNLSLWIAEHFRHRLLTLRRSSPLRGGFGEDPDLEQLIRPADEGRLLCRLCGAPITGDGHRVSIEGRHVHRRVNPAGIEFEFGCFDEAPGARVSGQPIAEFSWFAGYTWAFSLCWQCGAHLGWFFEGRDPRFHGLVLNRLTEEKPEGSGGS